MPEEPIDLRTLNELRDTAGAEFVAELAATFFEEAPLMLAELRAGLAAGSAERFRRAAHSLKTNAHTFGAMALGAQARALELGGLPTNAGGVEALEAAYGRAAAALKELCRG